MRRLSIWLNRDAKKRREEIIQEVTQGKFPDCKIRLHMTATEYPHMITEDQLQIASVWS